MKKENLERYELENMFNDMIDDSYPMVKILDFEYLPSEVFYNTDPEAYKDELLYFYEGIRDSFYCEAIEK
jgi:hypothetical protein